MESAFLEFDFKGEMHLLGNPKYQTLAGGLFFVQRCPAHLPSYCLDHPCVHGLIAAVCLTCLIKEADRYD